MSNTFFQGGEKFSRRGFALPAPPWLRACVTPVADLRVGQIGHGLGPHATPSYMTTHCHLKIFETAQKHNFTIHFESSENASV